MDLDLAVPEHEYVSLSRVSVAARLGYSVGNLMDWPGIERGCTYIVKTFVVKSQYSTQGNTLLPDYHPNLGVSPHIKMRLSRATLALSFIGAASARPQEFSTRQELNTTCDHIHYVIARGTTESYPGSLGSLLDILLARFPNSNYEDIVYPATQETSTNSYWEGLANGTEQIKRYVDKCPDSKIVLMGYSQGALVVGDLLAGGGNNPELGNTTTPPYINFATYGQRGESDDVGLQITVTNARNSKCSLALRRSTSYAHPELQSW